MFGLGAHLWSQQHACCSGLSDCVASEEPAPTTQVSVCKFGHQHHVPAAASTTTDDVEGESDSKPHQHDSEHCSVCRFFALPQTAALTFVLPALIEAADISPIPAVPFVALERVESWRSRAPPRV